MATNPTPIPTMDTTFNIDITSAAIRGTKWLHTFLHARLPPSERPSTKIILNIIDWSRGHWMYPKKTNEYRYIRVVIDVQKGKLASDEDKQALMRWTVDTCLEYEGRHAAGCEVEVRVNEVEVGGFLRVKGSACR